MKKLDFNCFSGNWPFHKVRYNTVEKIRQLHARCGIEGGFISACEAIFYQDPYEAEVSLSKELAGTGYYHAMILNPALPAWRDDLRRAVAELNIQAIRLVPGYHGYQLTDPVMDEVSAAVQEYKLPLIITLRTEDDRTVWMIRPRPIPIEEVAEFLKKNADIPTLITNIRPPQLAPLAPLFAQRKNLCIDTSGFMTTLFPVDDTWETVNGQMVFGSNAPMTEMHSIKTIIDLSAITQSQKDSIFCCNAFLQYLPGKNN